MSSSLAALSLRSRSDCYEPSAGLCAFFRTLDTPMDDSFGCPKIDWGTRSSSPASVGSCDEDAHELLLNKHSRLSSLPVFASDLRAIDHVARMRFPFAYIFRSRSILAPPLPANSAILVQGPPFPCTHSPDHVVFFFFSCSQHMQCLASDDQLTPQRAGLRR